MKRLRSLAAVITLAVLIGWTGSLMAGDPGVIVVPPLSEPVPVANHSFEDPTLEPSEYTAQTCSADPTCIQTTTPVVGWITEGSAGTWHPTAASYPSGPPDGSNVAYAAANGGSDATISQVLEDVLEPERSYILAVDIGHRADRPFPGYKVQLWAGETLLAEDDNTLNPAPGTFERSTITADIGATHPGLGLNLKIVLISKGRQTSFDNVLLTFEGAAPSVQTPFYVTLFDGEEQVVAKSGPLELIARCQALSSLTTSKLVLTSTQDGWFTGSSGSALDAGDEIEVASVTSTPPRLRADSAQVALASDGSYMGIDRGSVSVGVVLLGYDCVAIGTVTRLSAP